MLFWIWMGYFQLEMTGHPKENWGRLELWAIHLRFTVWILKGSAVEKNSPPISVKSDKLTHRFIHRLVVEKVS